MKFQLILLVTFLAISFASAFPFLKRGIGKSAGLDLSQFNELGDLINQIPDELLELLNQNGSNLNPYEKRDLEEEESSSNDNQETFGFTDLSNSSWWDIGNNTSFEDLTPEDLNQIFIDLSDFLSNLLASNSSDSAPLKKRRDELEQESNANGNETSNNEEEELSPEDLLFILIGFISECDQHNGTNPEGNSLQRRQEGPSCEDLLRDLGEELDQSTTELFNSLPDLFTDALNSTLQKRRRSLEDGDLSDLSNLTDETDNENLNEIEQLIEQELEEFLNFFNQLLNEFFAALEEASNESNGFDWEGNEYATDSIDNQENTNSESQPNEESSSSD